MIEEGLIAFLAIHSEDFSEDQLIDHVSEPFIVKSGGIFSCPFRQPVHRFVGQLIEARGAERALTRNEELPVLQAKGVIHGRAGRSWKNGGGELSAPPAG